MSKDIYLKLQERIDGYALGYPATESGIEIKLLQHLFSEEEADLYLHMSRGLEPVEVIAGRAGISSGEAAAMLESMTSKGLTFPKKLKGKNFYAAAPFMHGFFENNAWARDDREAAELMEKYMFNGYAAKGKSLRTVPVNASIQSDKSVSTFDDVIKIVGSKERIGLMPCPCANHMKSLGHTCERPNEVCIGFDFYGEYVVEGLGVGRWISRKEALDVLEMADEAGLVHQTGGDSVSTECICNCCPDCCSTLRIVQRMPVPSRLVGSNYRASISADACTLCGACIDRCPMNALTMTDDELSLNTDRCIGCGLCSTGCPTGAILLVQKNPGHPKTPPPPDKYIFMRPSREFDADIEPWKDE